METSIDYKLKLMKMIYGKIGRLTKFDAAVYGFVLPNNETRLIDFNKNEVLEKSYNIRYISNSIIVLDSISQNLDVESIIIDKNSFKLIYESSMQLMVEYEIIYEEMDIKKRDIRCERQILDLNGNIIGSIEGGYDFSIDATDNDNYYIASYDLENEDNREKVILFYDKDKNTIEKRWQSKKWLIRKIGYGRYTFANVKNFSEMYVYDIINKEILK